MPQRFPVHASQHASRQYPAVCMLALLAPQSIYPPKIFQPAPVPTTNTLTPTHAHKNIHRPLPQPSGTIPS